MHVFVRNFGRTVVLVAGLSFPLVLASAQSMQGMPSMNPPAQSASPQPATSQPINGQMATMGPGAVAVSEFAGLWRRAEGVAGFSAEQKARMAALLQDASAKLARNWSGLQKLRGQEGMATGDSLATVRKRIKLAEEERDLIVSETETGLGDFLAKTQIDFVLAAGFHGVSKSHSDAAHPMAMGMTQTMSDNDDLQMRLADSARTMNVGFQAVSLDTLLKILSTK
ncbi:MAG: hypothetical protein Q8O15_09825 [Rectinemataceae bacterium]|nr:hypothetical protein [Rectinemataceae bacterium]